MSSLIRLLHKQAKDKQARYYNQHAKQKQALVKGNTVRVKLDQRDNWIKGQVTNVLPFRSYVVKTEDGSQYRRNSKHVRFSHEPIIIQEQFADPVRSSPSTIAPVASKL